MTIKLSDSWAMRAIDTTRDSALTPRRDPLMRDDDAMNYGSDREFDETWFERNGPGFRLLTPTHGELCRAMISIGHGHRGIRLARFPGPRLTTRESFYFVAAIVFPAPLEPVPRLNTATNAQLEYCWHGMLACGFQLEVSPRAIFYRAKAASK